MRRAGGAAVEFAITLPVLMVLLAGVIEWGCFLQRQVSVVQAARDGALAASLTPRSGDAAATAEERARSSLELAGVDGAGATVTASTEDAPTGSVVRVIVEVPYAPLLRLLPTPVVNRAESAFQLVRP